MGNLLVAAPRQKQPNDLLLPDAQLVFFRKIIERFALSADARSMTKRYCFSPCDPGLPESAVAFTTYFLFSLSSTAMCLVPVPPFTLPEGRT